MAFQAGGSIPTRPGSTGGLAGSAVGCGGSSRRGLGSTGEGCADGANPAWSVSARGARKKNNLRRDDGYMVHSGGRLMDRSKGPEVGPPVPREGRGPARAVLCP